jgi:hypothetical protein
MKSLPEPAFTGDDGAADPTLAAALSSYAEGRTGAGDVLAALAQARLLVPVVAMLGESEVGADGLRRDKTADMAVPILAGTDGRRALPAFTSLAALTAWDPAARPVPAEAARTALSAYDEGCEVLVVDVAGPHPHVVEGARLRALAQGTVGRPVHEDPAVRAAVEQAVDGTPGLLRCDLGPGAEPGASLLTLHLDATLGADGMRTAAMAVAQRLQDDEVVRARLGAALDIAAIAAGP